MVHFSSLSMEILRFWLFRKYTSSRDWNTASMRHLLLTQPLFLSSPAIFRIIASSRL